MSRIFGRVWCRRRRIWPGISDTRRTNDRHGLSSPHKYLKINVEAYRCWCAAWTSNPVIGANPLDGGFDSHTLPPHFSISAGQLPRSLLRCEVFSWDARELSDQLSRHFCSVL